MKRNKAFTLIELLVVIAIIALLLSIIMPALKKAKQQAKTIICRSNLKQWGLIWGAYFNDYENKFMDSIDHELWVEPLRPYYKDGGESMRMCPTATEVWPQAKTWFAAWDTPTTEGDYRGSYGINNSCYDSSVEFWWEMRTETNWRKSNVSGSGLNRIPLFLDCWRWGGGTGETTAPGEVWPYVPQDKQDYLIYGSNAFNRYCLDRHDGNINVLFFDFSARQVGLKELWRLKWNREFDTSAGYRGANSNDWPDWIAGYKEY